MPYRAVLFDAGGTLFTIRAGRVERFLQVLQAANLDPDHTLLREAVARADLATGWPDAVPQGTRVEEDALWLAYCDRVWERIGALPDTKLRAHLAAECRWLRWIDLYPDTQPALRRLHQRARLSVLSNNVPSLSEALESTGL